MYRCRERPGTGREGKAMKSKTLMVASLAIFLLIPGGLLRAGVRGRVVGDGDADDYGPVIVYSPGYYGGWYNPWWTPGWGWGFGWGWRTPAYDFHPDTGK